ncbi:MAG TPA: S41 family peptidase [Telluria sp.]|nr:S41 family peptidase [Telluria sp.]
MAGRIIACAALALCASFGHASEQEAKKAYDQKQYPQAAALYLQEFDKVREASLLYNAACSFALAGERDLALDALSRALEHGWLNADATARDTDFDSLRSDPRWPKLIEAMKNRQVLEGRLYDSPAIGTAFAENLSEDEKIAGLSKLWSEVKYNFVYVETLKQLDWDKLYVEYLPKVRATRSTLEYYRVLTELIGRLQDGHSNVVPPDQLRDRMWARPLMRTRPVEGRVFVDQVFSPSLQALGIAPGLEVTAVDGVPVAEYMRRDVAPYQSASTPQDMEQRTHGYGFLAGDVAQVPKVTFVGKSGKPFTVDVPRATMAEAAKAVTPRPPFELKMLPGGVAYVALNGFGDQRAADAFIAAFPQIRQARALVIDVRANGGGNSDVGYRVLATLTAKPFLTTKWATREYHPTFRAWGRAPKMYQSDAGERPADGERLFTGPVAVLTSGATYSAAEDFALAFDTMKRGPIIGEPTGGSTGQPLFFSLPGGGRARVCTKQDLYADGRKFVGVGIQPSILVRPTVADLRKNKDTVLNAALAYVSATLRSK